MSDTEVCIRCDVDPCTCDDQLPGGPSLSRRVAALEWWAHLTKEGTRSDEPGFVPWNSIEAGHLKAEYDRAVNALAASKMRALMLSIDLGAAEAERDELQKLIDTHDAMRENGECPSPISCYATPAPPPTQEGAES